MRILRIDNLRMAAGFGLLAVIITGACGVRWGDIILIPENFEGWVTIKYEVPRAAPLGREGLKTLVQIPIPGVVSTSSSRPTGYGADQYYLVGSDGHRSRLPTEFGGCPGRVCAQQFTFFSSPRIVTVFFVGRAESMPRYLNPVEGMQ
jgi:hypothetical protein